jgi:hypothetical protein
MPSPKRIAAAQAVTRRGREDGKTSAFRRSTPSHLFVRAGRQSPGRVAPRDAAAYPQVKDTTTCIAKKAGHDPDTQARQKRAPLLRFARRGLQVQRCRAAAGTGVPIQENNDRCAPYPDVT